MNNRQTIGAELRVQARRVQVDPDTGQRIVTVVRQFVQERLYVRTADDGDVAVPFSLAGAPSDPDGDDVLAVALAA